MTAHFIRTALCGLILTASAAAWDPTGHMLVGQIAWEEMTPTARAKASALARSLDTRFNAGQPYNFVTATSWMDDMRGLGRNYLWGPLHYIDIPWTPDGSSTDIPPAPNVVSGIEDSLKALRDPQTPAAKRTEAFAMLVHFVGDIHQPLHSTERDQDRGGNTYFIAGVPFSDLHSKTGRNLHTFWDKAFRFDSSGDKIVETWKGLDVAERPKAPGEGIIATEAKKIMAEFPPDALPELQQPVDPLAWAKETYKIACAKAYPPGDPPPNTEVRELTPQFVHDSSEIAKRRIAIAGYRLGALLNDVLGH